MTAPNPLHSTLESHHANSPNQAMQLTPTAVRFTLSMIKVVHLRLTLALGRRS